MATWLNKYMPTWRYVLAQHIWKKIQKAPQNIGTKHTVATVSPNQYSISQLESSGCYDLEFDTTEAARRMDLESKPIERLFTKQSTSLFGHPT